MEKSERDRLTARVRDFYDGPADRIYRITWGDSLHLGVPREPGRFSRADIEHATELMASHVRLDAATRVLDLGSGYGGPARFLASRFECRVKGLNVSKVEIEEAQARTANSRLDGLVSFDHGDFQELPYANDASDVVWSQDSLMYGADKRLIVAEAWRVFVPGGYFIFTDILASRSLNPRDRARLYECVRTPEMWDTEQYLAGLIDQGFKIRRVEDWSEHVYPSYAWAAEQTNLNRGELTSKVGTELVERTLDGLAFWVHMAKSGNVGWALIVAQKPSPQPEVA